MTFRKFIRFAGLALLLGGVLAAAGWLLFALLDPGHNRTTGSMWMWMNFLIIFGGLFIALGLPGFFLSLIGRVRLTGIVGFVLLFVGIVLAYVAVQSIEAVTAPLVPARMLLLVVVAAPSLFLGGLLMGYGMIVSAHHPRWLGMGLILSVLLGALPQLVEVPGWLARGLIPAVFPAWLALVGFYVFATGFAEESEGPERQAGG